MDEWIKPKEGITVLSTSCLLSYIYGHTRMSVSHHCPEQKN